MSSQLSWSWCVSTYQRETVLPRALALAAAQSRPPKEIIVVDASPGWQATRERVLGELAPKYPGIEWKYVPAEIASLTCQRNQGIALATADVVFLFDDDALMYPDCAEQIMKVYDADVRRQIVGVGSMNVNVPPDHPDERPNTSASSSAEPGRTGRTGRGGVHRRIKSFAARYWDIENLFLPYDGYPRREIPQECRHLKVFATRLLGGYRMTYRRSVVERERCSEVLRRYSACEDFDISYRASRHGVLVNAVEAKLCHLLAPGGRLSPFATTVLYGMNMAVLLQLYASDRAGSRRRHTLWLAKRFLAEIARDLYAVRLKLPHARGVMYAMRHAKEAFGRDREALLSWYPTFQAQLIEADRQRTQPA